MTRNPLILAACGAVALGPALAFGQQSGTVDAIDTGTGIADHRFDPSDVTISAGGTVTFEYRPGAAPSSHDVVFDIAPSACSGLPAYPQNTAWTGQCRFDTPGKYHFKCEIHTSMTGSVTVLAAATPTPSPSPSPGGGAPPPGADPPAQAPLKSAVALARTQRGTRVRGSVEVTLARSRLEVSVWAARRALAHSASATPLRVGRTVIASTPKGRVPFSVTLNSQARSALRRHRRLAVTVRFALTPPGGHKLAYSSTSTLKAS